MTLAEGNLIRNETSIHHLYKQHKSLAQRAVLLIASDQAVPGNNISLRHCLEHLARLLRLLALGVHVARTAVLPRRAPSARALQQPHCRSTGRGRDGLEQRAGVVGASQPRVGGEEGVVGEGVGPRNPVEHPTGVAEAAEPRI
jgi:hypothetical protein